MEGIMTESATENGDSNSVEAVDQPPRFSMVGIGASAGGLEALSLLVGHLPADLGLSYVVVQHMSPNYRSLLAQLLGRETSMEVKEAEDGESPRPNVVYITPSNRNLTLAGNAFQLLEPEPQSLPKPSVNAFFASLAECRGEEAIAVVLSGTGSDGASGVRAVKSCGGVVIAQTPASAKYEGMPQSAIDTGCVDLMLAPEAIAAEIALMVRTAGEIQPPIASAGVPVSISGLLSRVLRHTRVDFSGYKENTVWRRILRRMATNRVATLEDYVELTERNPDELGQLCKEILISVTSFFRDIEHFDSLRELLKQRLDTRRPGDEFRIWVPGCATGEEAYSVAILMRELLAAGAPAVRVQVFATDIDMDAMSVARRGIYNASSLANMPQSLVKRYFVPCPEGHEIGKSVRELVVFARQDLVRDPPFLRLDLVSCRNVLIYFQQTLQEQVLGNFHFALLEEGLLFLGKSESVQHQENLFSAVSREGKVFRRRSVAARAPFSSLAFSNRRLERPPREPAPLERLLETAVKAYVPPSVLIDGSGSVLHVCGDVDTFLKIQSGRPELNALNLVRKDLRTELQTLMHQCRQSDETVSGRVRTEPGSDRAVRLVMHPVHGAGRSPAGRREASMLLLSFEPVSLRPESVAEGVSSSTVVASELEHELLATREHLQTLIEELETSNEESQALNEELQSSNEELQAANEELQSANEELQSTNEELTTVNEELQVKTAELVDVNGDFESILDSVGFAVLMVSEQMRVLRTNSQASHLFNLATGASGMPLERVLVQRGLESCAAMVGAVIREGTAQTTRVEAEGHHYRFRCAPRRTPGVGFTSAVITLIDETDLIDAQSELRESRQRFEVILENSNALIAIKSPLGRYEFVNPRFVSAFGGSRERFAGLSDEDLIPDPEEAQRVRLADLAVLASGRPAECEEAITVGADTRYFRSLRFVLRGRQGEVTGLCVKMSEITGYRNELEGWQAWMNGWRELVLASGHAGLLEFDSERVLTRQGGNQTHLAALSRLGGGERTIQSALEMLGFDIRSFDGARSGVWQGDGPGLKAVAYFSEHGGMCLVSSADGRSH